MSLSRRIEEYIKRLLETSSAIEVQRSELADTFKCVPSQINYVLSTRFTPNHGYLVESRRGGGGYLRIVKLSWGMSSASQMEEIYHNLGIALEQWQAEGVLGRLRDEELITTREYLMLKAVIDRDTLQLDLPERDKLRTRIIQAILATLSRKDIGEEI